MKKILASFILGISLFSSVSVDANENLSGTLETNSGNVEISTGNIEINANTGTTLEVTSATSNGNNILVTPSEDITYNYYYGSTCPHCLRVAKFMDGVDGWNKLGVNKYEIWSNPDNAVKMNQELKDLGMEGNASVGVPFLVVNENGNKKSLSGETEVIDYFAKQLGVNSDEVFDKISTTSNENSERNQKIFLVVVLILAVLIPLFFIIPKNKK